MIVVKGRELLIPNRERYIGTTYDDNSEIRTFFLDRAGGNGVDLSALSFRLDLEYENGGKDTALLEKEVGEDSIVLTWNITKGIVQVPGTLFAELRATDSRGSVKWASFRAAMYVEEAIDTPGQYTGSLTELEQCETRIDAKIEEMQALADSLGETEEERQQNEAIRQQQELERQQNEAEREEKTQQVINTFESAIEEAKDAALLAESWTVGGTGVRQGEDGNNSKYYSHQAEAEAERAKNEADRAAAYAGIVPPTFRVDWNTMELIQESAATGIEFYLSDEKELSFEYTA